MPTTHLIRTLFIAVMGTFLTAAPAVAQTPLLQGSNTDTGSVWWNELVSKNPDRARDFYQSVMGWTPKIAASEDPTRQPAPGESEYTTFMQNGTESAGLTKFEGKGPDEPKPGWLMYVQVADVDDAVAKALVKGGKVIKAPTEVRNLGRIAIVEDPEGNPVGLFAPAAAKVNAN